MPPTPTSPAADRVHQILGKAFEKAAFDPGYQDAFPLPWWVQKTFRLYEKIHGTNWRTKPNFYDQWEWNEKYFAYNDFFRYWSIVGVGNFAKEAMVGQAGEVEPYGSVLGVGFHVYDPASNANHFPDRDGACTQELHTGCFPISVTTFNTTTNATVELTNAGLVVINGRSIALMRFKCSSPLPHKLCVSVTPFGPHGVCYLPTLKYERHEQCLVSPNGYGILLDSAPDEFGVFGNGDPGSLDHMHYLDYHAYGHLKKWAGTLNGNDWAEDRGNELCMASFAYEFGGAGAKDRIIDVRVPLEANSILHERHLLKSLNVSGVFEDTVKYWDWCLKQKGLQLEFPVNTPMKQRLENLVPISRGWLRLLADEDTFYPGPSELYNKYWVRDAAIEACAAALAGDGELAEAQFLNTFRQPWTFHQGGGNVGASEVPIDGFCGAQTEIDNREWDGNGLVLWSIGRYARTLPLERQKEFCAKIYFPYVLKAARWYNRALTRDDILPGGWSAEHLGQENGQPFWASSHYWDVMWAMAGLYEAARMAERCDCYEKGELWSIFDRVKWGTIRSIRWSLDVQRKTGQWQTFVPSGPYDQGVCHSSMIGSVAYFSPARLYMREKLEGDIDHAMRMTLETIWSNFIDNGFYPGSYGFRHENNENWRSYGAYLSIQVAHAFLCIGDIDRMEKVLLWCANEAFNGSHGALNEQHLYPLATNFHKLPPGPPWVGDIPHGWSASEFIFLIRSLFFMEADEDNDPTIYLAPGVPAHWFDLNARGGSPDRLSVRNAPTIFGGPFGFSIEVSGFTRLVKIELQPRTWRARFVYTMPFGSQVSGVKIDGRTVNTYQGRKVFIGAEASQVHIQFT